MLEVSETAQVISLYNYNKYLLELIRLYSTFSIYTTDAHNV